MHQHFVPAFLRRSSVNRLPHPRRVRLGAALRSSALAMVAALLVGALPIGCTRVLTEKPVASKSQPELLSAAEGLWIAAEDGEPLFVKARSDGTLAIAGTDWDDKRQEFRFQTATGIVASTGAGVLLSVRDDEEKASSWRLVLLEGLGVGSKIRGDGILLASEASVDWFRKAVRSGALAGTAPAEGNVVLSGDTATITNAIKEAIARHESPFDRPLIVLRRVSRPNWGPN
jgi:hypothetical protein